MGDDFQVHFRYHDGVNALIGMDRWRYEKMPYSRMVEAVKSLAPRGYDGFAWRRTPSLEAWHEVDAVALIGV